LTSVKYQYQRDLDEITAMIDGMALYLENVQYAPGKTVKVINRPSATRDMDAEIPCVYIVVSGSWERFQPTLVKTSIVENDALARVAEFTGKLDLVVISDNQDVRSVLMLAIREALDPDIRYTNTDGVSIPLPRYFGGFTSLKGVVINSEIDDNPESVLSGEFNGNISFSCDMPIFRQCWLAEGVPTFRVKLSADEE